MQNVREIFLDDGVDEQILQELKLTWDRKVAETKSIDHNAKENESATVATSTPSGGNRRRENAQRAKAAAQQQQQQSTTMPASSQSTNPQTASNSTESPNVQSVIRPNVIPQNATSSPLGQVVLDSVRHHSWNSSLNNLLDLFFILIRMVVLSV